VTAHERGGRDQGSGTVWTVTLVALVWLVAAVAMTVGGVRAARHRANAAADLAALAAAAHAVNGSERACATATVIARGARARLIGCTIRGGVSDVRVAVTARLPGLGLVRVPARARAGPAGVIEGSREARGIGAAPGRECRNQTR
jgi:secretion/DNA translocation related TadE-like protein